MPLVTRLITNVGSPILAPDGSALAGITISFRLTDLAGNPASPFDTLSAERITGVVNVMTDSTGVFSVNLWPNDRGDVATQYICSTDSASILPFTTQLASGGTTVTWLQFKTAGTSLLFSGVPAYLNGATALMNTTVTASNSAVTAAATAVTQAGIANTNAGGGS